MKPEKLSPRPMFLQCLIQEVRDDDPIPAAILWVESSLRPIWIRLLEYIYLKVCELIAPNRAKQMTIGLAQLQLQLWKEFMETELGKIPSIADWENPIINFRAVKWYLLEKKANTSLLDISRAYTGQTNEYYAMLLSEALESLREL